VGLILRENQLAVFFHVEDAATAFNEGDLGLGELFNEFSLQTGGFGKVVSLHAILNFDLHAPSSF
jgi:hypothetical protein